MNFILNLYVERTRVAFNFYRKNMSSLLCFMAEIDIKDFDWSKHLTSFSAMKHNKDIFSIKVKGHSSSFNIEVQNWNSLI